MEQILQKTLRDNEKVLWFGRPTKTKLLRSPDRVSQYVAWIITAVMTLFSFGVFLPFAIADNKSIGIILIGLVPMIGIPLAVAGKVTLMAPSASMTIHPIRMSGLMIAAPQTYHYFERLQDRITRFVAAHSHITEERFRQLMLSSGDMANDVGSIVYGEEAVAEGLMDRVGTLSDALNALYRQMER